MGRRATKLFDGLGLTPEQIAECFPPLREHWRQQNRYDRQVAAWQRAQRKARDKKRRKCRCEAYPWPHRPGGGFCRYPDPPLERWQPKHDWKYRPYRERYAGIRRQIARNSGLHPIKDRALIAQLMPALLFSAKQLHRQCPQKYRNMKLTALNGNRFTLTGEWHDAGPKM